MLETELPAPPIPADADLTDFKFMPLEVARLRRSKAWLICKRRPELAFYMLNLWTAAWHERPAGSLEDDDDVLADAAMCSPDKWARVRVEVLRGWVKCSDGRLYHGVVAEKANDAWHERVMLRWRKECDRVRKENKKREEKQQTPLDLPPEPPRRSAGIPAENQRNGDGIPAENALKGREGKGDRREREGKGVLGVEGASAPSPPIPPEPDTALPLALDLAPEAEALRLWNASAERAGWPTAQRLTDTRRRALKHRLAECGGIEGWQSALAKAEASSFLTGKNGRTNGHENWRCDLDFMLRQAKFTKLMEGGFDDTPSNTKSKLGANLEALAEWGREGTG